MPKPRATSAADVVQLRNPDRTKTMPRLEKGRYAALRRTALIVLPKRAPGLTLLEFIGAVEARLPAAKGWDRSLSPRWWAMAIKLDLEARGEIKRSNVKGPQRLVRA